ncbi:thiamine pyrophosphate-dependent dehydrogenase E1 component subunit alpha [Cryptosporangium phraense]|uniref:Thiamine pyrophosphate-dependent dehydrogenase E1 component subunit alpha n=1 Tax=Cryptosporangium phraense TaxID=2593070 RepID=A0A545AXV7_9ACTN|nr:thiamine pyrophosphate-dependent dehydrogenase E1 component subunit alpha [Cryptosporangium phraense]TQS46164.1 thiamine pyrophosphate-dependent dehydrogenase E1 component subunit alpha [Cryptosporangium phraense]
MSSRLEIYRVMVLAQAWEQALLRLIDENLAPASYHPGRGSEGSEVGATLALEDTDYLLYDHRGMAHIIAKGTSLTALFGDFLGNELGTTNGLGAGIVHVADPERGVLGQSGTLGGSQLIASGAALSAKLRKSGQVTMCFMGDGAANRGTFHEAANAAGAWKLPLVFVVQNNGWAVSTPTEHSTGGSFVDRAKGYGWHGVQVDGQNPFDVHDVAVEAVERARSNNGPTLIEVKTVRLTGHYLADPQQYRSAETKADASTKDPIVFARKLLHESGEATEDELEKIEAEARTQVDNARDEALKGNQPGQDLLTRYTYV